MARPARNGRSREAAGVVERSQICGTTIAPSRPTEIAVLSLRQTLLGHAFQVPAVPFLTPFRLLTEILMDTPEHCREQAAHCVFLMSLAKNKTEARSLQSLAQSWIRVANQLERYAQLSRSSGPIGAGGRQPEHSGRANEIHLVTREPFSPRAPGSRSR